jgi:hypothetical protein
MVGTCANPACTAHFHTLRRGKLFVVEARVDSEPITPTGSKPVFVPIPRQIQYFWLCEACAKTMRVVFDRRSGCVEPSPPATDHMRPVGVEKATNRKEAA